MGELTAQQIAKMAEYKLTNQTSCLGCKFYFHEDHGYSNWTVEETRAHCALKMNPNLPATVPYDQSMSNDNWPATMKSRCHEYNEGALVCLDVEGEHPVETQTNDHEQCDAIRTYCNLSR